MSQLYSNNIDTTLAATLSDVATSATLADGSGLKSPTGGNFEILTLISAGVFEIVRVTARSGNVVTITRAQEGTTAQAWAAGTRVFAGVTAGTLAALLQNKATGDALALGSSTAAGDRAIALGWNANGEGSAGVSIGRQSWAQGAETVAVGFVAGAYKDKAVSIGRNINNDGIESVCVGHFLAADLANQAIVIGDGGYTEAHGTVCIGEDVYVGGADGVAIGAHADVDFGAVGGVAIGDTAVVTQRSMQAAAVPVVPRANGMEADAAWKMAGSASILCSAVLDLKTLQTYTITLPTGVTFFPEEVGVIITAAAGVTLQPSVRFGATADEARYLAITQTAADAVHGRDRYTTLASAAGSSTLRAEVTTAATGTTLSGRVYWRGFAVVNAA